MTCLTECPHYLSIPENGSCNWKMNSCHVYVSNIWQVVLKSKESFKNGYMLFSYYQLTMQISHHLVHGNSVYIYTVTDILAFKMHH